MYEIVTRIQKRAKEKEITPFTLVKTSINEVKHRYKYIIYHWIRCYLETKNTFTFTNDVINSIINSLLSQGL